MPAGLFDKLDIIAEGGWVFVEGANYAAAFSPDRAIQAADRLYAAAIAAKAQPQWPPTGPDELVSPALPYGDRFEHIG